MPRVDRPGGSLYYEALGSGEPVVFTGDVGMGAWVWGWQASSLAGQYQPIVWELWGTGRSDPPSGPLSVAGLARDLEAVLSECNARSAILIGVGLGGMISLQYALEYDRANALVLMGTTADGSRFDAEAMRAGPDELGHLLSEEFRESHPDAVETIHEWRAAEDADQAAAEAHVTAAAEFDCQGHLHEITIPASVLHGTNDAVVPIGAGEALADALPRGEFEGFEDGEHFFFIEQARLATDAVAAALQSD